jgi:hypothetical protein
VQKTSDISVGISRIFREKGHQHRKYVTSPLDDFYLLLEWNYVEVGNSRILRNNDGEVCVAQIQ